MNKKPEKTNKAASPKEALTAIKKVTKRFLDREDNYLDQQRQVLFVFLRSVPVVRTVNQHYRIVWHIPSILHHDEQHHAGRNCRSVRGIHHPAAEHSENHWVHDVVFTAVPGC